MNERINNLKERIDNISNLIGENESLKDKDKTEFKTISDSISFIKSQIINNSTLSSDTINKSKLNIKNNFFYSEECYSFIEY